MRPLHIAILGHEKSIHTRRWVKSLRESGLKVDLITFWKDSDHDVGGISLGASDRLTFFSKLGYLTAIGRLKSMIRKLDPDILHAHQASGSGFLLSFVDHPRKIVSVWGDDIVVFPYKGPFQKMAIKRSLTRAHRITATSGFLEQAIKRLGKQFPKVTIIPFGIDLNHFRLVERGPGDKTVVGISKWLHPKYGIDILIRAFDAISKTHQSVCLIIGGNGPFEMQYKALVEKLGLNDKVEFTGLIDHKAMPDFLARIDIYAMPSIHDGESFGVAALEAAATGLPVVSTTVGGVPEAVLHEKTGILVGRGDVQQLQNALVRLIRDPELRTAMGRAGRKHVEDNYRWEDNLRSMQELYLEMME